MYDINDLQTMVERIEANIENHIDIEYTRACVDDMNMMVHHVHVIPADLNERISQIRDWYLGR